MKSDDIARALLQRGAVLLRPQEPFTFASGLPSPIYCDNRLLLADPVHRIDVVDGLTELSKDTGAETVAGTATAGIPWGAWVADRLKKPFIYVRSAAKEHGKGNRIEGEFPKGSKIVVLEDLISTGRSVLSAIEAIQDAGGVVVGAVAIFTYGFSEAEKAFKDAGVSLHTLVNLDQLLTEARKLSQLSDSDCSAVLRWRKDPRNWAPRASE